jgi:urease accessory protein
MRLKPGVFIAVLALTALLPEAASAHLVSTRFGDFYDGMLHPLTAFEHMIPWLALGLLAGSEPKGGRWVLIAFPAGLALGVALGAAAPDIAGLTTANIVSLMILGGLVALALPLPGWALGLIACAFGISHGYANGTAMTGATNAALFMPGVVIAGYLVVLLVAAPAAVLIRKWGAARIAVRALGSWIFAIGVMMLGTGFAA